MAAPKNIRAKAEQLDRALDRVARLAFEIEEWAEKHGVDGPDFSYYNQLTNASMFNLSELLAELDAVADGEWDPAGREVW